MERRIDELINELQQLKLRHQQITREIQQTERENNDIINRRIVIRLEVLDNDGTELKVGDTVRILNKGLFRETSGTITKLGKSRVSIRLDNSGQTTTRKSTNLRLIEE
jgi:transcription antitermination factor NusG